jgi:hypothetical protein
MARPPTEAEEAEFAACATDRRKAPHALRGYAPSFAAARAQDAEYCERVSSLRGRLEGALARRGEGFGSSDPKCGAHAYLRLLLYMHSGVFWLDDSGACVAVPLGAFGAATSTSRHLRDPAALAALRRTLLRSFHRMGAFPMHDAAGVFLVLPPPPLDPGSVTGGSVAGGSVAGGSVTGDSVTGVALAFARAAAGRSATTVHITRLLTIRASASDSASDGDGEEEGGRGEPKRPRPSVNASLQ